ncbi:MAG: M66 family metalloprotease [Gemmatimonadota bacterium]|nr:M66 family metalloprotease [Gemmatimonadota bacterium]
MEFTDLCVPSTPAFLVWYNGLSRGTYAEFCGSRALTALYWATDGAAWTNHENWLSDAPLYEWYGVSVGVGGLVSSLDLANNNMTGTLPAALGDLKRLETLNLSLNDGLSGSLPRTLKGLQHLERLLLDGTRLCTLPYPDLQAWLLRFPNSRLGNCDSIGLSTAYLTQATQSLSNPVPLVAGEDALLRVFISAKQAVYAAFPPVRAIFYLDGAAVHTIDVPGPGTSVLLQMDEGDLASSANALVPGAVVAPGLEMVIEIDPAGVWDPVPGIPARLPRDGRTPIPVADVPPFDLTLVPFAWTDSPYDNTVYGTTVLTEIERLTTEHDVFRLTRDILPVREFILTVHEPVWTSTSDEPTVENRFELLMEVEAIRTTEGASGYYMGIFAQGTSLANLGGFVSVAAFDETTIAHELGHNMSLLHAPCNVPDPDPDYPYPDGSIGAWGYDVLNGALVSPDTPELMSYCNGFRPQQWISDYNFTKALRYRVSQERALLSAAYAPSASGLLLWGGVSGDGELVFEPAFAVDAPASPPRLDGPYRIVGVDEGGSTLYSLRFGMAEIADGKGGSFAFVVPVRADWPGRLDRITLSGPEGVVTLGGEESEYEEDDSSAALLLDQVTGKVRGLLRDWPEPGMTLPAARRALPEPGLEVVISRGVPHLIDWNR